MKYGELNLGQVEAIVNKLGGMDGVQKFLRGELTISEPVRRWSVDEDGVIHFSVVSDGKTGAEWIAHFEKKGIRIGDYARQLLLSPDFSPTSGVTTAIAVLPGKLFSDSERITKKIRSEADKRKFAKPNAEVACLVRDMFTDNEIEAMGLYWIVAMHEPIKDSGGYPSLLSANRDGAGRWLNAYYDYPDRCWDVVNGFAFAVSQVSS